MSIKSVRSMFYLLTPSETYYQNVKDIPNSITTANEMLLVFQLLEFVIGFYKGKKIVRFNDIFGSMSAGIISQISKLFIQSIELSIYIWIYERYSLFPYLEWNSPLTYWISFIGIDFSYYWLHRMGHEVNLFWSTHQSHHSSEYYNISVSIRQGFFQSYFGWIFYLPLSLFIPPQIFLIHLQMNLMYQFWIHTEVVSNLGPFEYLFNCPSHHRVHHGRNPYCIDKNYGGVLIIWDRLFRTFAQEKQDEQIVYGLVYSSPSFNPIHNQICHLIYICKRFFEIKEWKNKFSFVFKSPSWKPGLPRLGNGEYPRIEYPIIYYNPNINFILSIYTFIHFIYVFIEFNQILKDSKNYSLIPLIVYTVTLMFSLITFGKIFDKKSNGISFERIRLLIILFLSNCSSMKDIYHYETFYIGQVFLIFSFIFTFFLNH